jgi:site-specific recombinase XerD
MALPLERPEPRPPEVYQPPGGYRLEQLAASWLAGFEANTAAAYRTDLGLYLGWCADHGLDPLRVGLPEVQVFGRWLSDTPSARTGKPRAPRTVARALASVSSWYTHLNRAGAMHYHPAAHAERPRYERRTSRTRGLSEAEARALCAVATTRAPRTWGPLCAQLTVHLLLDLGARVSELCNLDLHDLGHRTDHTGTTWRVAQLAMKAGVVRIRPIPAQLGPLLDAWRLHRIADPGELALLVDRDGRRITRHQVAHLLVTLATAAEIPSPEEITPHSCRHAFNRIAKARGAGLEARQHALGHSSPEITQLYDDTLDSLAADPAHLVAAATFAQQQ